MLTRCFHSRKRDLQPRVDEGAGPSELKRLKLDSSASVFSHFMSSLLRFLLVTIDFFFCIADGTFQTLC